MNPSGPRFFGFLLVMMVMLYLLRSGAQRRLLLLAASYYFYFELSHYAVVVLLGVTAVAYFGALWLRRVPAGPRNTVFFSLVCAVVLAPLLVFKYLPPMLGLVAYHYHGIRVLDFLSLVVPVGISFFTFAALGYLCDVYLEIIDPEPRIDKVALFLAFFPVISAGPIGRAQRFMPQLELDLPFSSDRAISAIRIILIGLVMKDFIANNIAGPADAVFAAPSSYSALDQFLGAVDFVFYLYSDFAGYSLIAIGSARLLGLDVMQNFAQPLLSPTIPELWRRWHISLSSWVADYIFAPLRMTWRRHPVPGMIAALMLSFTIIGVWHGAAWGFLFFGILHGVYASLSFLTLKKRDQFWAFLRVPAGVVYPFRVLITFLLFAFSLVLFRAANISDALFLYKSIFSVTFVKECAAAFLGFVSHPTGTLAGSALTGYMTCVLFFIVLIVGDIIARRKDFFLGMAMPLQIAFANVCFLLILAAWLSGHGTAPFVYYKF